MTCPICAGLGMVRVRYHDGSPDDFGICQCEGGQALRAASNARPGRTGWPLWTAFAASRDIPLERVSMVEDLLEEDDLARIPVAPAVGSRGSVAATMQTRRPRL